MLLYCLSFGTLSPDQEIGLTISVAHMRHSHDEEIQ